MSLAAIPSNTGSFCKFSNIEFILLNDVEVEIIDEIVREPLGGAHRNHKRAAIRLKKTLRKNLLELKEINPEELVKLREEKFRKMGKVIEEGA